MRLSAGAEKAVVGRTFRPGPALARLTGMLHAERGRWFLFLPVCLGAGIGVFFALPADPPGWAAPAGVAGAAALVAAVRRRATAMPFAAALLAAAIGVLAADLRSDAVEAPVLAKRIGPVALDGRVLNIERRPQGVRVLLDRVHIGRLEAPATPIRVRVTLRSDGAAFGPGDRIALRAILAPPPEPSIPGAFDFARQAYFERLGAVGFSVGAAETVELRTAGDASLAVAIARLRHAATARIEAVLPAPVGAVAAALMTGSRGDIPEDVVQSMRDSGLAHLLAISGLHVGLVAGTIFVFVRLLLAAVEGVALRWPVKKLAAAAAIAAGFFYLLLSGGSVPTQRAFIIMAIVMTAVMIGRSPISLRLLAVAAIAVLLLAPETLLGVSFQMSFAAATALVALYEVVARPLSEWRAAGGRLRRIAVYFAMVVLTTGVAGLATAPFAAYHFNTAAQYGIAANLVAIPIMALWVMPAAAAAFALMPFGLEGLALAPMGWGIEAIVAVAREVSSWQGAVQAVPAMPVAALIAAAGGGLWLCLWRRRWRLFGLAGIAGGIVIAALYRPPDLMVDGSGRLAAIRLDGHGLALLDDGGSAYVEDLWLRRAGGEAAEPAPREGYDTSGRIACDVLGCIYRAPSGLVAVVRHPAALDDDCRTARVVIGDGRIRPWLCRGPERVIDRFDLWREGGHAVWLDPDGVRVDTVQDYRGDRKWSRPPWRGRGERE